VDEDTLVKLVAFARTSLAPAVPSGPSTLVYFERFEVHPIKVGSYISHFISKAVGIIICHSW
jgi:hypothetical protein